MTALIKDTKYPLDALGKLSPKKQLNFITEHEEPMKLVNRMPASELLMLIRDLGAESSLELLEMMKPSQVQRLLDLEIWPGDVLDLNRAGHYFSLLFAADGDRAIEQIHGLDIELIGLMFKATSDIHDVTLGEEVMDFPELYSISPDGRFIICFRDDGCPELKRSLHRFLEELYGRDLPFALRMLEAVRLELASGLEEQCLRWREGRMLDLGILPRMERLKYFSPISTGELKRMFESEGEESSVRPGAPTSMRYWSASADERYPFLRRASETGGKAMQGFFDGLSQAAANMHASLSGDFGDRDEMIRVCEYVKFLAELGLMQLCHGELDKTGRMIDATAAHAIRVGRTALTGLRKRLSAKLCDQRFFFGRDFERGDSPLKEVARAICLPEPRYYEGLLDARRLTVRFFASAAEVNATISAVNELIFRAELMSHIISISSPEGNDRLSHAGMFARIVINNFFSSLDRLADISGDRMSLLFADGRLIPDFTDHARSFADGLAQDFAKVASHQPELAMERIADFTTAVLIQLEKNWRLLMAG